MLEYLLLGTFIVVLSVTTVWTIRALETIGKACYQAFLPSSKGVVIERGTVSSRLSEKLEKLPMPWGWCRLEQQSTHTVQLNIIPAHIVIPWGWPGNLYQDHSHDWQEETLSFREPEDSTADVLQFPLPMDDDDLSGQDPLLEINGSPYGGFKITAAGGGSNWQARLPWGW